MFGCTKLYLIDLHKYSNDCRLAKLSDLFYYLCKGY